MFGLVRDSCVRGRPSKGVGGGYVMLSVPQTYRESRLEHYMLVVFSPLVLQELLKGKDGAATGCSLQARVVLNGPRNDEPANPITVDQIRKALTGGFGDLRPSFEGERKGVVGCA